MATLLLVISEHTNLALPPTPSLNFKYCARLASATTTFSNRTMLFYRASERASEFVRNGTYGRCVYMQNQLQLQWQWQHYCSISPFDVMCCVALRCVALRCHEVNTLQILHVICECEYDSPPLPNAKFECEFECEFEFV